MLQKFIMHFVFFLLFGEAIFLFSESLHAAPLSYSIEAEQELHARQSKQTKQFSDASKSDAKASFGVGIQYYYGWGVNKDLAEAFKWFTLAAEKGDPDAMDRLGSMYQLGEFVAQSYDEALRWYSLAADKGHKDAPHIIGRFYREGLSVNKNISEAIRWYKIASDRGNTLSQYTLGEIYSDGDLVAQDYEESFKWYKLAADNNNEFAQAELGILYYTGKGVNKNYTEAYRLLNKIYKTAAGSKEVMFTLGEMYYYGHGVTKGYQQAFKMFDQASMKGHLKSQLMLAILYNKGRGAPQNYILAHMWANTAAAQGDADAEELRDAVAEKMTTEQISQAQMLAEKCISQKFLSCGD